jgi:hypothetical protein
VKADGNDVTGGAEGVARMLRDVLVAGTHDGRAVVEISEDWEQHKRGHDT